MKRPPYVCQYWHTELNESHCLPAAFTELLDFWSVRSCGLACASSALLLLEGIHVPVQTLFNACVSIGGYTAQGWRHEQLAQVISTHGITAQAMPLTLEQVIEKLTTSHLIIASVTHKFPCDGRRGGHLVLLYALRNMFGQRFICFMDPTTWGKTHHAVTVEQFSCSFSMKGIVLSGRV